MSKVTSKYQVSIPKALADKLNIQVGDELAWEEAGGTLRARIASVAKPRFSVQERLRLFDASTARQAERERQRPLPKGERRGWRRAELYTR